MGFVKLCHYVIVIHDDWMIWGYAHDLGIPHTYIPTTCSWFQLFTVRRGTNLRPRAPLQAQGRQTCAQCEAKDGGSHFDAGDVQYIDVDLDGFRWI